MGWPWYCGVVVVVVLLLLVVAMQYVMTKLIGPTDSGLAACVVAGL